MSDENIYRKDFPIFKRRINGKPIVYLDSTATALKPQVVIDKENEYYTRYTANIFRGIYTLSEEATSEYEVVRKKTADFIHATTADEIVFTRNTTEAINLIAAGIGKTLTKSDEVVMTMMEHHSNFVPWQQRAQKKGLEYKVLPIGDNFQLNLVQLDKLVTGKTKVFAVTAVSNVLGTINPIADIVRQVKRINPTCLVVVDAAQAAAHMQVNVQEWGADAVAFSSHKMCGPTGVGVLWAKMELQERMSPYQYGGEMIEEVRLEKTTFKKPPHKFEAGTPNIAGVIGFGAALDYLTDIGMTIIREHEIAITDYALSRLSEIKDVEVIGPRLAVDRGGVVAFTMKGVHAHDIAQVLDEDNICIRSGHHCAMPLHLALGLPATARASFYIYTTKEDVDKLVEGLQKVQSVFK